MIEVKPCPFCGVVPIITNGMLIHYPGWKGGCVLDGYGWPVADVDEWNRRVDNKGEGI